MSKSTRATKALEQAGIAFTILTYDYDPDADKIGMQAAEALGERPERVLKTLMALVDGKPVCVIVPSDREVSMKKLAAAFGGKAAQMMKPADAERISGYKVGGISPFGQTKPPRTAIEAAAMSHDLVTVNGGQRGLQVRLRPQDAAAVLQAIVAPLVVQASTG
jgi:Cys-tRNA(Pro)/Cys-tRNA(Cys) deacylase